MQKPRISIELLTTLLFAASVFLFFYLKMPNHLHFREQFQLFLFSGDYFVQTTVFPGGFSNYLGRFFTQFFVSAFCGALLVALFLTLPQILLHLIIKATTDRKSLWFFISFIPSIFYWYLFCDGNSQFGGLVAFSMSIAFALLGTGIKSTKARIFYLFLIIPVTYFLAGGAVILTVAILLLFELQKKKVGHKHLIITALSSIIFVLACPFAAKMIIAEYPMYRFIWGVDYIHFVMYPPYIMAFMWILSLLTVFIESIIPEIGKVRSIKAIAAINLILVIIITFFAVNLGYKQNKNKEEIMAYDYLCRSKQWTEIIRKADKKPPTVPMTVTCLNLALYKTGQLPEKMFHYFQNGPEGLLPTFQRDFMIPMVGGEPYYYLGFVNTAQRFAFEAMEALPDYQKSARSIKRLAETNLINGKYEVARKYLNYLDKTLFYSDWAKETRKYLNDEEKINSHPEWGEIRKFRTNTDFLFSEQEKDQMLGFLFQQNRSNRMAFEYLMAYTLLTKNLAVFKNYLDMEKNFSYSNMPESWQQALIYVWGLRHNSFSGIPYVLTPSVVNGVSEYARIYTGAQNPEPILRRNFSKNYCYYLHFRKYNETKAPLQYQY